MAAHDRARTLLLAVGVLVAFSAHGFAREEGATARDRTARLRRDLASADPATVAHAAFTVAEERLGILAPDLVAALDADHGPDEHAARVRSHLLDALIQCGAQVPVALLERWEERHRWTVLILAARSGRDAHPLLRRALVRGVRGDDLKPEGLAAGNLLVAARDPLVASLFLGHVRPQLHVVVKDHDRLAPPGNLSVIAGTACGQATVPDSFPPSVEYDLEFGDGHRRGARVLAPGTWKSVAYVRRVRAEKQYFVCSSMRGVDATDAALAWTATVLGDAVADLPLRRRASRTHRWVDEPTFLAAIEAEREAIRRSADRVFDRLIAAGLLSPEERSRLRIEPAVTVSDARDDRTTPLPRVEQNAAARR